MTDILCSERDLSSVELARIHEDFARLQAGYGVPVQPEARFTFVATRAGEMVGCSSGLRESAWFFLTDLWVEGGSRGRGLGDRLLRMLEERVAGAGLLGIYTWTASFEAPAFYAARGYERYCELEGFYAGGHARVGFRKPLGHRRST